MLFAHERIWILTEIFSNDASKSHNKSFTNCFDLHSDQIFWENQNACTKILYIQRYWCISHVRYTWTKYIPWNTVIYTSNRSKMAVWSLKIRTNNNFRRKQTFKILPYNLEIGKFLLSLKFVRDKKQIEIRKGLG